MDGGLQVFGPVAFREFAPDGACAESEGHTHNYDHVTFVTRGRVKVSRRTPGGQWEDHPKEFTAGDMFLVRKDLEHKIKALEPGTAWRCVFAHRDFGGAVVQDYAGNGAAYV